MLGTHWLAKYSECKGQCEEQEDRGGGGIRGN